jgi:hypothetical protein
MSAGFKLQVTLLKCTFAKPVSYFVSLHLKDKRGQEVDKQRTELSGPTTTPAFTRNEFELMIPDSVSISNVRFACVHGHPSPRCDPVIISLSCLRSASR